jgi:hypothetical protein
LADSARFSRYSPRCPRAPQAGRADPFLWLSALASASSGCLARAAVGHTPAAGVAVVSPKRDFRLPA